MHDIPLPICIYSLGPPLSFLYLHDMMHDAWSLTGASGLPFFLKIIVNWRWCVVAVRPFVRTHIGTTNCPSNTYTRQTSSSNQRRSSKVWMPSVWARHNHMTSARLAASLRSSFKFLRSIFNIQYQSWASLIWENVYSGPRWRWDYVVYTQARRRPSDVGPVWEREGFE